MMRAGSQPMHLVNQDLPVWVLVNEAVSGRTPHRITSIPLRTIMSAI